MVIVAAAVTAFGLLTTLSPERDAVEPETIDPGALVEPEIDPGFRVVAELREAPWENHRIAGAYLVVGDAPTIVTDDDQVFEVDLPGLEVVFGAIPAGDGSIAFGRSSTAPAVWRSSDNVTWTLDTLPWDGTVRAAAEIEGRLTLIGIARDGPAFTYVTSTEAPTGWLVVEMTAAPDSGLISVPGGFVGRGRASDGGGFGYLYSSDGVEWRWQSKLAAAGRNSPPHLLAFVIETDEAPLLKLPGDERVFAAPEWPISGLWLEDDTIWVQTPSSAWASRDGIEWQEYPINAETGVDGGYSVLLPVGDTARLATSVDDRIHLLRWDPGSG
jgi:hypothetical protein